MAAFLSMGLAGVIRDGTIPWPPPGGSGWHPGPLLKSNGTRGSESSVRVPLG